MPEVDNSSNDIGRALGLIKSFGNAVFISGLREQGDQLVSGTLARLSNGGLCSRVVELNIAAEITADKNQAGPNIQNIIHSLGQAEGKAGLIVASLEAAAQDDHVLSALSEAIQKKSVPILAATNMEGFRKLEERPGLSGLLQFILSARDQPRAKRDKAVLIIGATSLFGSAVYQLFRREYADVHGTGFSKADALGFDKLDVTSEGEIKKYFSEHPKFDIIVYIAGEANADVAEKEKDRARMLNTDAVLSIARSAKDCKFVYISSEYVFDGNSGPYGSGSRPKPVNYYGLTKLEGEDASLKNFSDALILRLGALYGYNGPHDKETTVSKLISALDKPKPLEADNVQIKHPILLEDAAGTLLKLLDYGVSGIYQANGPEGLNKQEMAERIAAVRNELYGRVFAYPIIGVEQAGAAAKPFNTHMVNIDTPRPFDEGIRFLFQKQEAFREKRAYGH